MRSGKLVILMFIAVVSLIAWCWYLNAAQTRLDWMHNTPLTTDELGGRPVHTAQAD